MADNTVGQTYRLRIFTYNNDVLRKIVVPDSLTLALYDPNNILVYSDNKPIPVPIQDPNNNNATTSAYLFSVPGTAFAIEAPDSAPYRAIVSGPYMGDLLQNSIPITVSG